MGLLSIVPFLGMGWGQNLTQANFSRTQITRLSTIFPSLGPAEVLILFSFWICGLYYWTGSYSWLISLVIYSRICVGIVVSNLHVEFYLVKILIRCWNFENESWEFAAKYSHNWLKNAKKAKKFDLSLIQYPIWAKARNPKPNRGQKNWPNPSLPISFLRDSCTKKFHKKEFYYYCWTFWTCTFWRLPSHLSIVVTKRTFYKSFTKLLKQNIFSFQKTTPLTSQCLLLSSRT